MKIVIIGGVAGGATAATRARRLCEKCEIVLIERDKLARGRRVIAYCQVGQRGYVATLLLRDAGFDAANLAGGFKTYRLFHPDTRSSSSGTG
jgi:rhodanese-related sulfurtransferase